MRYFAILLFSIIMTTEPSDAQQPLPVKRISIFKNGTALVTREGKAPVKEGNVLLPIPREILFGSYWIGAAKDNSVKSLVFKNDTIQKKKPSKQLWHFLAGNVGKTVSITLSQKPEKPITGKIVSFDAESMTVKVKQDNRVTLLHVPGIYQIDFTEEENKTFLEDEVQRIMLLKPEKASNELSLQELYMQHGINWIPSYLLKLKDDKTARLEMKAVIENTVDDWVDAETELVVGSPQLFFGQRRDPVTYDYLTVDAAQGGVSYDAQPMQMLSNAVMRSQAPAEAADEAFTSEFSTEGEKASDLYIYKIGKVTLPKNGKGSYSVFATSVEYKDKYEGIIPDKTNYFYSRYCDPGESNFDVFHSLELKNTASVPLTTAPVLVINQKEQFLAQDIIKYTPVGGAADVKLSKAIDIVLRNVEEESSRIDQAKKIGKTQYGKVVIKGTVSINNLQDKEVTVVIKKNVNGSVTSQSDSGKVTKGSPYNDLNPFSTIQWEVKMSSNTRKSLSYEYEVFFQP
jgi:hypothetical protein